MTGKICKLLVFSLALIPLAAIAQQAPSPNDACGDLRARFDVKQENETQPARPEAGKALVFFIEKDLTAGTFATPTTRFGLDGRWVGATHGNSHFHLTVEPGVHHVCAYTQFGGVGGEGEAFSHFSAEAGAVYYIEVKNTRVGGERYGDEMVDVALLQPDDDQGKFLAASTTLTASHQKK